MMGENNNISVCNATFVGKKCEVTSLNDMGVSIAVGDVKNHQDTQQTKCNIEFSDRNLLITFIKKDEGFESDGELEVLCAEEKIIKDHVFKYNKNASSEDISSVNTSESECETSDHNISSSIISSSSCSPTEDTKKYKFDRMEVYSMNDVLFCHVDRMYENSVSFVIRNSGSHDILVFECQTEDNAKLIYNKFNEQKKRTKLERHRRRKSDGGSVVSKSQHSYVDNELSAIEKVKNKLKWNLIQHTDRNGVTHIEVESSCATPLVSQSEFQSESQPKTLIQLKTPNEKTDNTKIQSSKGLDKSKFALELENILSSEIKKRDEKPIENDRKSYPKLRPAGESLSLRQRAPAILLRKLDEFEEKAHRIWAKAEADEENKKIWSKTSNSVIGISTPPKGPLLESVSDSCLLDKLRLKTSHTKETRESKQKPQDKQKRKEEMNQILIPTKTGREPPKKFYPKESPMIFDGRLLPLGVTGQMQPSSLPVYPMQAIPWNRYSHQLELPQGVWRQKPPNSQQQMEQRRNGRSRSRDPGRLSLEQRRRAQSKSPARRPAQLARHQDHQPEVSSISRIFKEFSDALMSKMAKKNESKPVNTPGKMAKDSAQLKSNLKKDRMKIAELSENALPTDKCINGNDNKKVHFNKFATVQMMQ